MPDTIALPQSLEIHMVAQTQGPPSIEDVGLFLYDLGSVYEIARLREDPRYESYHFSRFSLYRNGRPIDAEDRMLVTSISLGSPLDIVLLVGAAATAVGAVAAAVWTMVQLLEKIHNFPLNREKLELEVKKLKREESHAARVPPRDDFRMLSKSSLSERPVVEPLETLERRLATSRLRVTILEVHAVGSIGASDPSGDPPVPWGA